MVDRLGVTVGLGGGALADEVSLCERGLELGYTDVWSAEVNGGDAFTPLVALARSHTKPRLGTAIVPVFTRTPALLAMSAAAMQNLATGRFVLGLGTSSGIIVENWMGLSFTKPLSRLRETVEVVRDLLSGKRVTLEGATFSIRDFKLQLDPTAPTPIYVAALGPRACRLAGEIADGVIFFLKTADGVRQALDWVREGARAAGRDPAQLDCVIRLSVAVDEDSGALRKAASRSITTYAMVDVYNRSLVQQGFEAEAKAILGAWRGGERERAAANVSDEMLDQLIVSGDAETCRTKLAEFRQAGVTTPVLLPMSVAVEPQERDARVAQTLAALAPRERPSN